MRGQHRVRIFGLGFAIVMLILASVYSVFSPAAHAQETAPAITGQAAIVIDASTGSILYEDRSTERLPMASLTKIFTSYFAIESTPLQRRMIVEKDDLVGEASAGLDAGENLSFETLLHGLMLASGNDAAMTIARNVGESYAPSALDGVASYLDYVNAQLPKLGIMDTNLVNPHGLDAPGHYSTARDIAMITMLALQSEPDFLRVVSSPGYLGEGHQFVQRNQLIGTYSGALGGKTGITDNAGYSLMGIAHRDGRTLVSVVLGSTSDAWYRDTMALLDVGFATPSSAVQPTLSIAPQQPVTTLASSPSGLEGMTVQSAEMQATRVMPDIASSQSSWDTLRWPIGAALTVIVALVVVIQGRALIELQKRPRARGRRPSRRSRRTAHRPLVTPIAQDTQPINTIGHRERIVPTWSPSTGD